MKCRIDIKGRKTWIDNDNMYDTRPKSTEIVLYRDGKVYKTVTLDSAGDGKYSFNCLLVYNKHTGLNYDYQVDEITVPDGYTKRINGYNITNTLYTFTINGTKTWKDNFNAEGKRPSSLYIYIRRNDSPFRSRSISSLPDTQEIFDFSFLNTPFADAQGVPYVYTIIEDAVEYYTPAIDGFNITNTFTDIIIPFSFSKKCIRTQMSLQGAQFEIRQNGVLKATAISDSSGIVSFSIGAAGIFQMTETQPPAGYRSNITVYEVIIASDGTVTIDGQPAAGFIINNQPISYGLTLTRATDTVSAYIAAPNTWALHGTNPPGLYMVDKIIITPETAPVQVRWDYGVKTVAYFALGGGYDVTSSYANGIPVETNGIYTVYVRFTNGYETIATINIDRLRDGSATMPYLLIDYSTAAALEPLVTGTGQFTLDFMQGERIKLAQHYEIYENIDMEGKSWEPLGTVTASPPYAVIDGFTGGFYGNGHDIVNLVLANPDPTLPVAFFRGVAGGAAIQNLSFTNCHIEGRYAGGFISIISIIDEKSVFLKSLMFDGTIQSTNNTYGSGMVCYADITNGSLLIDGCILKAGINGRYASGILANCITRDASSLAISNCYSSGSIQATSGRCSGVLGEISAYAGEISIINCISDMTLKGQNNVAGIIAYSSRAGTALINVASCCNLGNIEGYESAGIVSYYLNTSSGSLKVENCYNVGKINANSGNPLVHAGGIVGISDNNTSVQNCYNTGDVITARVGNMTLHAGGLAGMCGIFENSAAICETVSIISGMQSKMSRISPVAAFSGNLNNNIAFDNMRALIDGVQKDPLDTGNSGTDGISVSAADIKTQALYENTLGWDFTNVWSFGSGAYTLPVLKGIPLSLQPTVLPPHLT